MSKLNLVLIAAVALIALLSGAALKIYTAGRDSERLKSLEEQHVIEKKSKMALEVYHRCVASRGLAHCVHPDDERRD